MVNLNLSGDSDTLLFYGLFLMFIILGVTVPLIYYSYSGSFIQYEPDTSAWKFLDDNNYTTIQGILAILFSVFNIFFWTFGQIPFWIDLFVLLPLRIMLLFLAFKNLK